MEHTGGTKPVSLLESSDAELECSSSLEDYILASNVYEDLPGLEKRRKVVEEIEESLLTWIKSIAKERETTEDDCKPSCRFVVFGGHLLDIVSRDSDIDALCLVPKYVTRDDLFSSFHSLLVANANVTDIRAVQTAHVPIMKFKCHDIEVDLLIAVYHLNYIPKDLDLLCNDVLASMDAPSIRSLNGYRETLAITHLVPDSDVFKSSVKVIRHWAKNQGLYSSALGFLGGMSWNIMVAKVCQLYPKACAAVVINKFFRVFSNWVWPQPVLLKELEQDTLNLKPWNPKVNHGDTFHVLPVITPAYPEHNCAFSATKSACYIITEYLQHAASISEKISVGQEQWSKLFQPENYCQRYKHFIMITAKALSHQDLLDWSGLVEAKIRKLVEMVEKQQSVHYVHVNCKHLGSKDRRSNLHQYHWLMGLKFKDKGSISLDLATDMKAFSNLLQQIGTEGKLFRNGMTIEAKHIRRKNLQDYFVLEDLC